MATPSWRPAVALYLAYCAVIFTTWTLTGADYRDLASDDKVVFGVVLPMSLGALLVLVTVTGLRWWRPVLFESPRARPAWAMAVVMVGIVGFVAATAAAVPWSTLSHTHVAMLAVGTALVGFNEEVVTRGVLLTGLRGTGLSETRACWTSAALFGAMHLPNALFGMPWIGAPIQFVLASVMGLALYVLRRTSGSLWIPMGAHGAWDFVSLSSQASHAHSQLAGFFQFGTYGLSLIAVAAVLRGRTAPAANT